MEQSEDTDMRPLWSVSYPKRKQSITFHALCHIVSDAIKNRAELITPHGNFGDKLHQALNALGVQEDEFYQFQKESNELGRFGRLYFSLPHGAQEFETYNSRLDRLTTD